MRIPGADKAIDNLMKWSANEEWAPFREQVFAEHFDMICDRFDTTEEEIADLLGHAFAMDSGSCSRTSSPPDLVTRATKT